MPLHTDRGESAPKVRERRFVFLPTVTDRHMERSQTPRHDAIMSLKLPRSLKREARETAENEGITLSEMVRRKLQELDSQEAAA